jgi:hypothetical protein
MTMPTEDMEYVQFTRKRVEATGELRGLSGRRRKRRGEGREKR